MFDKILRIGFSVFFMCMLLVPLLTTNLHKNKVSESEKRYLTQMAQLYKEDGTLNENFTFDFEAWINDNIGLRDWLVINNAKMQFHVFNLLSNNSDMFLGPNGELNYATKAMISDYQHFNLKTEETLKDIAESFQICSDYLEKRGIQFYYFQCWDKHSIYPEHFPNTIIQQKSLSKTDQVIDILKKNTDVTVISPKDELINAKNKYETYSEWGDPTHWTQRGAYIGYKLLMNVINQNNNGKYNVLKENDYDIIINDQGSTIFGGIHKADYLEDFSIKNPKACQVDEDSEKKSQWQKESGTISYYNVNVDNEDVLLIMGDSYFNSFIYDDLAESFKKVVLIWGDHLADLVDIVDYYNPTIVIVENAERCDRNHLMVQAAKKIQGMENR